MAGFELPIGLNMVGASGLATDTAGNSNIRIPPQYHGRVKYVNVDNMTSNTLQIFAPHDNVQTAFPIFSIGPYLSKSIQMTQNIGEGLQFKFINPDAATYTQVKAFTVVFSEETKNWNHSMASSYTAGGGIANSVTISGPLDGSGNVKVNAAIPVNGNGNVKTAIVEPIDGSGNIKVAIQNTAPLPCVENGKAWASHVFAASGSYTFKSAPGTLYAMQASAAAGQQILDGAAAAWKSGDYTLSYPIVMATNITVSVTGACTVWVLYS